MRLSFLLLFLSTTLMASLILLNDYDNVGYVLSSEFLSFEFEGRCPVGVSTPVSFYTPPSERVDVYGDFPKRPFALMSNGITIGSTSTSVVVPEWTFNLLPKSEVYCYDSPIDFLSPSVVKVLKEMKSWELGSVVSGIMEKIGEYWELPNKLVFEAGEVVSLIPRNPKVDIEYAKSPGVGAVVFPKVSDFSRYDYSWTVNGSPVKSSILVLSPGDYHITLKATDSIGFDSSKSISLRVEPFQVVNEHLRCEIGIDNCKALTGSSKPGVYVLRSLKTYGVFTFVVDATETTFPRIRLSIGRKSVQATAEDPSGSNVFVFVNGRIGDRLVDGKSIVEVVALDPYGNATFESTEVIRSPDVRKILDLRSSFYLGWGR